MYLHNFRKYYPQDVLAILQAFYNRAFAKNCNLNKFINIDYFSIEFDAKNCNDNLLKFITKHIARKHNVYSDYSNLKNNGSETSWKVMIEVRGKL